MAYDVEMCRGGEQKSKNMIKAHVDGPSRWR
jgi:hypothetical protein